MAKQNQTPGGTPQTFDAKLVEDRNDFHLTTNEWTQARNAINNSKSGDLGKLGNEPGTLFCAKMPYTVIGAIHLYSDMWLMLSTNNTDSEIGIFRQEQCTYELLVNDQCLGFNTRDLIIGTSKPTGDCTIDAYWDDSRNPTRFLRINNKAPYNLYVPYVCTDILPGPCIDCQPDLPLKLDCDKIRLAPLVNPPCFRVAKGVNGGTLLNGSYFVVAAYTVNQLRVTDYFTPSNIQSLFSHENVSGSLDIFVDFADPRFDEYELVLVSTINQQTVARRIGIYSTSQSKITLDIINNTWTTVPIEQISLLNAVIERADSMFSVQDYLIRVGPYNKLDFNYQPFANQIVTVWQSVEYPADYYRKGGNNTGYLRDEVYPFFIRWVYSTGDKSNDYHIPGRPTKIYSPLGIQDTAGYGSVDTLTGDTMLFETVNTASNFTFLPPGTLASDGVGTILMEGYMGYWESTELYPDNKPQIWNSATNSFLNFGFAQNYNILSPPYIGTNILDYDLCGKAIRHHKMPDNAVHPLAHHFDVGGNNIRILGIAFKNIKPPLDNEGNLIPGIIGYEILRGSRQGNRSIIAKGIINNMGVYSLTDIGLTRKGAYANYPYNDLHIDPFLSTNILPTQQTSCGMFGGNPSPTDPPGNYIGQDQFSNTTGGGGLGANSNLFSFHSPDTNFTHPFLSIKELKSYGKYEGNPFGKFEYSEKHPKSKLVTNVAFVTSLIAGLGIANTALLGTFKVDFKAAGAGGYAFNTVVGTGYAPGVSGAAVGATATAWSLGGIGASAAAHFLGGDLMAVLTGVTVAGVPSESAKRIADTISTYFNVIGGSGRGGMPETSRTGGVINQIPNLLRLPIVTIPIFLYYLSEGTDATMRLIKAILRYRDFALKYNSHCFYNNFSDPIIGHQRREIDSSAYIGPNIQDFGAGPFVANQYRINNQYRATFVAIDLKLPMIPIVNTDNSREQAKVNSGQFLGAGNTITEPTKSSFNSTSNCTYVGLKQRIRNQYGQLNSILQMPVTTCVQYLPTPTILNPFPPPILPNQQIFLGSSISMFNGDIYIGRYTEKNTFFFFYEWLYDQPDGYEFDYLKHRMLLQPTYWANFESFETQDFVKSVFEPISNLFDSSTWIPPERMAVLDGRVCDDRQFAVKNAWFYLFQSGVRDFFVESEINIDQRDWGDSDSQKHFSSFGGAINDTKTLFDTSIIKSGNHYKYDQSLSISKIYINYVSWGFLQLTHYDPYLADTCYQHRPKRVIYSLPANFESKKDYWRIFLPLNYKDFIDQVTCIKPINKNGAIILFETTSPIEFQGSDTLETGLGTKLTIGDGKLFNQPLQSMVNTDDPYEYASCQNRLSVINTPVGAFWISQNQGKIFTTAGGLKEISGEDMKWWFAQYLPYKLTQDFPDFDLTDNTVSGIGCQSIYDNLNGLIYFCKKDYTLRKDILDIVTYEVPIQTFMVNSLFPIETGDPNYFNDASWTISYDPKTGGFVSYHDWHPDLLLPSKTTFMSISKDAFNPLQNNGIWIHNERCDLYCNYYGRDYPFEVEFMVNTGQNVNSVRSIEYIMEMYNYAPNCYDRYHVLNENFDEATIYNTEQCSGLLRLDLTPRNDLSLLLQYPIINPTNIQILYSKAENKYRFNMFWDITRERGGQDVGIPGVPSFAQQTIWNTPDNGYAKVLNSNNMNYNKVDLQRKKIRHYTTTVLLRKLISGSRKIMVMISQNKLLNSPR